MSEPQPKDRYDVVVIGGGPAGSAAAVYTARHGLTTAVVAGELGGQIRWAGKVGNYLGKGLVAGEELARSFREHVEAFAIDTFPGREVDALVPGDGVFEVYTKEGLTLTGRAVIIATGRAPARLAVPGEKELLGRGVSYCATCDAAFFRGRPAAVVGPGETAAGAALQLAALDAHVVLVNDKPLRADASLLAKLDESPNVDQRIGAKVKAILGEDQVTGVVRRGQGRRGDRASRRRVHRGRLHGPGAVHRRSRADQRGRRDRGGPLADDESCPGCSPPATSPTSSASRPSSPPATARGPAWPPPAGCSGSERRARPHARSAR